MRDQDVVGVRGPTGWLAFKGTQHTAVVIRVKNFKMN